MPAKMRLPDNGDLAITIFMFFVHGCFFTKLTLIFKSSVYTNILTFLSKTNEILFAGYN